MTVVFGEFLVGIGGCARYSSMDVRCENRLDGNGFDETVNRNQIN